MYFEKPETKNNIQISKTGIIKIISRLNEKNKNGIPIFEGIEITTQNNKEIIAYYKQNNKEIIRTVRINVKNENCIRIAICEGDYMPHKKLKVSMCKNIDSMIALIIGITGDNHNRSSLFPLYTEWRF